MAIPDERETLENLDKEEKVLISIPNKDENPNYVTERVYVNGVCIQIPVGEDVWVSKTVREILKRKHII